MPFALDQIRKLGQRGHTVFTADTFLAAPGNHSRFVEDAFCVPSPRFEPEAFLAAIERIVREHRIDMILPTFEEAFLLARERAHFEPDQHVFAPDLDTLETLHDKARFQRLAADLGLPTPPTRVAENLDELRTATSAFEHWFARPVSSRGGLELATNHGPLAGVVAPDALDPTPTRPAIVQAYVEGTDVCSLSICRDGEVVAHAAYVHPKEIDHAGGIVFESVDAPDTLEAAQTLARRTGYHGQLSLDFLCDGDGRQVLIECNPRATAGCLVMSAAQFERAIFSPAPELEVAPAGVERKYASALLRDIVLHPKEAPEALSHLLGRAREVYFDRDDWLPGVWQFISAHKILDYRASSHSGDELRSDLMAAYFHDVLYDAEAAPDTRQRAG